MGNTADAAEVDMCISHAFKKVFSAKGIQFYFREEQATTGCGNRLKRLTLKYRHVSCALATFPLNSTIEDQIVKATLLG